MVALPALAVAQPSTGALDEFARGLQVRQGLDTRRALSDFAAPAAQGDTTALGELARVSPEAAATVQGLGATGAELSRKQRGDRLLVLGEMLAQINALPAEQRADKFKVGRQLAIQMGVPPERIPEEFDQTFVDSSIAALQQAGIPAAPKTVETSPGV